MKNLILLLTLLLFFTPSLAASQEMPPLTQELASVQVAIDNNDVALATELLEKQLQGTQPLAAWMGKAQIALATGDLENLDIALKNAKTLIDSNKKNRNWLVSWHYLQYLKAEKAGNTEQALKAIEKANDVASSSSFKETPWKAFIAYRCALALRESDNGHARKYIESAIKYYKSLDMLHEQAHALMLSAELEWDRKKDRRAFNDYEDALSLFKKSNAPKDCLAEAYVILAERNASQGNKKIAENQLKQVEALLAEKSIDSEFERHVARVRTMFKK